MDKITINDEELISRLNHHPVLRARIASLLDVVDDKGGDLKRADDAEDRVVEELRRMGQEALQSWAQTQVELTEYDVRYSGRAHRDGKKTLLAQHLWRHRRQRTSIPQRPMSHPPVCPKRVRDQQAVLTTTATCDNRLWR